MFCEHNILVKSKVKKTARKTNKLRRFIDLFLDLLSFIDLNTSKYQMNLDIRP